MRITNAMVYSSSLQQLQSQLAAQNVASAQVTTGQRNANVSDDPAAAGQVMKLDSESRRITQYQRNITSVRSSLSSEESTLDQVGDILSRAKELATAQGGSNASAASRSAASAEVDQLLSQVVALGNTKIGDQYVFGGNVTNSAPFQPDGSYVGDNGSHQSVISAGQSVPASQNGDQLFVSSGVLQSLTDLRNALTSNNATGIQNSITGIDSAFDQTQTNLASVGAETNALDAAVTRLDAQTTTLTKTRSAIAEIPLEEASLKFSQAQTALQAGLLATTKIINTSLVNYLSGVSG
jgi:flagellar hook-associated protein 3 FlgL